MIRLLSAPAFFVPENASDSSAKTELLYELCRQEAGAAADFAASFQPEAIIAAAQEIRKSRRIFIFAHDISKVPGEFLKSRLLLLSFQVTMIDLADLEKTQEYLQHLQDGDLVVFFSFPKILLSHGQHREKSGRCRRADPYHHGQHCLTSRFLQHSSAALSDFYQNVL